MVEFTRDQLWKAILEDLFDDFLRWFYEPYLHLIDFKRPFEFLDKELLKIYPESAEQHRFADKLVKVWLKNGEDSWFLLHVEAQNYSDPDFAERMYIYQYRIRDLHRRDITALAILADDNPRFRPNTYRHSFMGTTLSYQFRVCKIRDFKIQELEASDNPFALALATAWHGLKQNSRTDEQKYIFKIQLVKRLLKRKFNRKRIRKVLAFIKYYSKFERSELYHQLEEEIHPKREKMGILELVKEKVKEDAIKQGLQQGLQQGKQLALNENIEKLLQKAYTVQQIVDMLDVPEELVQKINDDLLAKNKGSALK